jgi:hypothetical protein
MMPFDTFKESGRNENCVNKKKLLKITQARVKVIEV